MIKNKFLKMDKLYFQLSKKAKDSENMEKTTEQIKSKNFYRLKDVSSDKKLSTMQDEILQMLLKRTLKYNRRKELKKYLKQWHYKHMQIIYKESRIIMISKIIKLILKWTRQRLVQSHFSIWKKLSFSKKPSHLISIYKNFMKGNIILKKTIKHHPLKSFFKKMCFRISNDFPKNILKTILMKFFSHKLNIYAVEYNQMQSLCKILKSILKFKEINNDTFLITILKNWWLATSMKKFKTRKIAISNQKKNPLYLKACEDLFENRTDSLHEYLQKVHNLNSKQRGYSEKFILESKMYVNYRYDKETREVIHLESNDSPIKYGKFENISQIKSIK